MPKYARTFLSALGYELAPVVVSSSELEDRLAPLYSRLHVSHGQLEALTGINERRWWEPNTPLSKGAIAAARKALNGSGVKPSDLGALVYCGVCRENFEPATACRVADGIGVAPNAAVYDISNACLGVLNGILDVANRIELGHFRAGLVVSCESAREINDLMIERMLKENSMERFVTALATLTGGSGAVAVLVTDGSFASDPGHQLLGGVNHVAPEHHQLCRWGLEPAGEAQVQFMSTDSVSVLKYGVKLGLRTWEAFLRELNWTAEQVDRVICHQVGAGHQESILKTLGLSQEKDYSTFRFLGNIGTVSLPMTAALAHERGVLQRGERVGFLGIGSGLNCMMLGLQW